MQSNHHQQGFTLIELLIVLAIIAIISMIALPSYRQYVIQTQETQVQMDMLKLSGELEAWRSQTLSYQNFVPNQGYDDISLAQINSPFGSTQQNKDVKYHIQLRTMVGGVATRLDANVANNWIMLAMPMDNKFRHFALTSNGIRCSSMQEISAVQLWQTGECGKGQSW